MSGEACLVDECSRLQYAHGWCNMHYQRWRRHGDADRSDKSRGSCSLESCQRPHYGRGLCAAHLARLKRSGSAQEDIPIKSRMSPEERFIAHVAISDSGCWLWTGSRTSTGYGEFGRGRRDEGNVTAHRWSYENFVGPIPDGLWVLHHCDIRECVNPTHLYAGTHRDNMDDVIARGRARKVPPRSCNRGHEYVDGSWKWRPSSDGKYQYRACKECHRENQRAYVNHEKAGQ